MPTANAVERVAELLAGAGGRVACLAGEGLAGETRPPTLAAGASGWRGYRVEEVASTEVFARDPELVWEYHGWLRQDLRTRGPGPAHRALARLQERFAGMGVFTTSVDGLLTSAGCRDVGELHGSLWRARCVRCQLAIEDDRTVPPFDLVCGSCGGPLRPDCPWFGEPADPEPLSRARAASEKAKLFLVVGTAENQQPFASLALAAKAAGALVVLVERDATRLAPHVHHVLVGRAGEILAALAGD